MKIYRHKSEEHGHHHHHHHDHVADPKSLKLLEYMLSHNKEHTEELRQSGEKQTDPAAQRLIAEAVHYYEHGNEMLEDALKRLSGGE